MSTNLIRLADLTSTINSDASSAIYATAVQAAHAFPRKNNTLSNCWRRLRNLAREVGVWEEFLSDAESARRDSEASRLASIWKPSHQGNAGDTVQIGVQRTEFNMPEIGDTILVDPMETLRDDDGEEMGACNAAGLDGIPAKVVGFGAHWSDQPAGRSGYWVFVEFPRPVGYEDAEFC